uniref:CHCH domain-containing protein n=1 Tax=Mola mola TaxID=94237 RepID=A0A3Q3XNA4_MOLML
MGSGESTTRKVSFGVDDEDRVRILRGVKLSEDVLQRMKGVANISLKRTSSTSIPEKDTVDVCFLLQAQQLQKKDSQLKALDAFYKEQLAQLEKRNLERYDQSKEQFHQAVSKTEVNVRSRNTDPVCSNLQAQILSCYRGNRDQTLKCSDLAKEYMQCIDSAKKVRALIRSRKKCF